MLATLPTEIDFNYEGTGEILCRNLKGLTFFLFGEPFSPKPSSSAAPTCPAPAWKQIDAMMEVEVRRESEPQTIAELTRTVPQASTQAQAVTAHFVAVAATHEVEVRRIAPLEGPDASPSVQAPAIRGTGELPDVPLPGKPAPKGWFNKLFAKA